MNQGITYQQYKDSCIRALRLLYPELSYEELLPAVEYSIEKHEKNPMISIDNNYKKRRINMTLKDTSDYIKTKQPIITSYGVMFKRHNIDGTHTPFYDSLESFIQNRTKFKNKMFEYPKGTEEYQKYNLLQMLAKIDCNAIYGVLGQYSSMFYNINLAQSITFTGRACISAAILFFEMFLADNVKWGSLNEIVSFIDEVVYQDKRIFKDEDILDEDKYKTVEDVFIKIMRNSGFNGYFPDERDMQVIWNMLNRLPQNDLNRLYYRNNLYEFCENTSIQNAIIYILEKLEAPFFNPNKPPKEIKIELEELTRILKDYVYHPHLRMDRLLRVLTMERKVSIITDTDSTIVSFDAWYQYIDEKVKNKVLNLSNWRGKFYSIMEPDEFGEYNYKKFYKKVPYYETYDFFTGQLVQTEPLREIYKLAPDDNLRHSIINIIAYIVSVLIGDYMKLLTINYNSFDEHRPECLIVMKNEFLFKRVLVTDGKKNYASYQELQEGNKVPRSAALDVKGMPIDKVTLQEKTRDRLKQILFEDILDSKEIDQIKVLRHIMQLEAEIKRSLMNGSKEYYKPVTIKSYTFYDNPMRIQGIKAAVIYNALKDEGAEAIDLERRNSIDIIKLDMTDKKIEEIKDTYPEKYQKIKELIKMPEFKGGIDYIGLPMDEPVPKWLISFIDYITIINDNLKNFPLDCIGIADFGRGSINYTNIINF